jgi:glutamyl-Q tRNA(Asp) synthetase
MVVLAGMSTTTRFAPSPTGLLHLGHVHAAFAARGRASAPGDRCLLRLEDIDTARCRPDFAAAILDDLAWLGMRWDGPVRVQSEHLADYRAVLDTLRERGLLYPCFCSRADAARAATAPHGPEGAIYPGTCRHLAQPERDRRIADGQPHAWRLDTALALSGTGPLCFDEAGRGRLRCDPLAFGDVVLGRRDAAASYHLAVTHDDFRQGVTLVTRGVDLLAATAVHRLLQAVMGWPAPLYAHHPLLVDAAGRRLSKRDGAATIRQLREAGHGPAAVVAMALSTAVLADQPGPSRV